MVSMLSLVVPDLSVTILRCAPTKTFKSEDLPAFGLPTIAKWG